MELVHGISKGFFDLCSINVIELYIDHLAVHLDASKERIIEEYKKKYELEKMIDIA